MPSDEEIQEAIQLMSDVSRQMNKIIDLLDLNRASAFAGAAFCGGLRDMTRFAFVSGDGETRYGLSVENPAEIWSFAKQIPASEMADLVISKGM